MKDDNIPVLLDSNILVYAYDKSDSDKHLIAKKILKSKWKNHSGVLSTQNLVEFYSIITKKIQRPIDMQTAKQIVIDLIEGFEIMRYTEFTVINAINYQAIFQVPFWDSLIASVMEENRIETVITENDKDFSKIKWINAINPFKNQL